MAGVWMGARVKVIVAVLDGILGLELEEGKAAKCDEEEGQMVEEVAVEERGRAAGRLLEYVGQAEELAQRAVEQLGDRPACGGQHGQARVLHLRLPPGVERREIGDGWARTAAPQPPISP